MGVLLDVDALGVLIEVGLLGFLFVFGLWIAALPLLMVRRELGHHLGSTAGVDCIGEVGVSGCR